MLNSTPKQLRFPPSAGFSIRADFAGGGLSPDLRPMLLRAVMALSDNPRFVVTSMNPGVATQIQQYKDRIILHLPSAYPFKQLLQTLIERMFLAKIPTTNSS